MSRGAGWSLLLLGVGASSPTLAPANQSGGPDACALLSGADFKTVTGEEVRNSRPSSNDMLAYKSKVCRYRGTEWRVEVHLERGRDAAGVKAYMQTLKGVVKQTTKSDAKPISGLGDEAWWGPIDASNGILTVVKGTDVIWVQSYGSKAPGAGSLEKTRALAEKVLANYAGHPKS